MGEHVKAQQHASKQLLTEGLQQLKHRLQPGATAEERRIPGVTVPFGMLKVTLHGVDLASPALCFCVIKAGPHWGRTATLTAATKATWNWEVRSQLFFSFLLFFVFCSFFFFRFQLL